MTQMIICSFADGWQEPALKPESRVQFINYLILPSIGMLGLSPYRKDQVSFI